MNVLPNHECIEVVNQFHFHNYCHRYKTVALSLWTIHNGVFGAPNVCNGAPIDEITLSSFIAQKRLLFCNSYAISVIGKLHGYVTFINLNFVLLSLWFVL